jgi:hypothetical protein
MRLVNTSEKSSPASPIFRSATSRSDKTLKDAAEQVFAALTSDGFAPRDIVTVSSRLIELVTDQLKASGD